MKVIALRNCPAKTTADFSPQTPNPAFLSPHLCDAHNQDGRARLPCEAPGVGDATYHQPPMAGVADIPFVRFCIAAPATSPYLI